jgi:hypothetical protein
MEDRRQITLGLGGRESGISIADVAASKVNTPLIPPPHAFFEDQPERSEACWLIPDIRTP